jgi:hypothetical protein
VVRSKRALDFSGGGHNKGPSETTIKKCLGMIRDCKNKM